MVNIIVAYDSISADIGENCQLSYEHLSQSIELTEFNLNLLDGENCDSEKVVDTIVSFDSRPFILVAYSHGKADALISTVAGDGYVNAKNSYCFGSSLIYTNSCHSAKELKQSLIDSNCFGYVGYKDVVWIPKNKDDAKKFISCENKALIHFLSTDDTLTESVERMKDDYMNQYYQYLDADESVVGGLLRDNLYLLDFHDCDSLRRNCFG